MDVLALSWRRAGTRQGPRRTFAENDHAQDLVLGDIADTGGADQLTVLHDVDAVGEVEHVVDVMADEEDADAVGSSMIRMRASKWMARAMATD